MTTMNDYLEEKKIQILSECVLWTIYQTAVDQADKNDPDEWTGKILG